MKTKLGFMAVLNDVIEIELSIIILILFNYPSKSLFFSGSSGRGGGYRCTK